MYLITEHCNEGTIEDLVSSKNLSEEGVLQYFKQILKAFKYLNSQKIIHRDVKPKNILIHNGQVKLADFGVAKTMDNLLSRHQSMSGTPIFMSPQII